MDTRIPNLEHDALMEGQRAGIAGLAAGLNPHPVGSIESQEWERGRSMQVALQLSRKIKNEGRAGVSPCFYKAELDCHCGGRGMCLDVA